jgi:hypothetical protein
MVPVAVLASFITLFIPNILKKRQQRHQSSRGIGTKYLKMKSNHRGQMGNAQVNIIEGKCAIHRFM